MSADQKADATRDALSSLVRVFEQGWGYVLDNPKRAYDAAAEALCEHIYSCPHCTMRNPTCPAAQPLIVAENAAWTAYREAVS